MNDDEFVDKAIELSDILEEIKPRPYFKSQLPNHFDQTIMGICQFVISGTAEQRQEFISLLDDPTLSLLGTFAHRMTMLSVRKSSRETLLNGLITLVLTTRKNDYPDILMTISLYYHSSLLLNVDPKELFNIASQYAPSDFVRKLLLDFLDRSPENQKIETMSFKEVNGSSGLVYQFGGQSIPEGWL